MNKKQINQSGLVETVQKNRKRIKVILFESQTKRLIQNLKNETNSKKEVGNESQTSKR